MTARAVVAAVLVAPAERFWDLMLADCAWYRRVSGGQWESYEVAGWTAWRRIR